MLVKIYLVDNSHRTVDVLGDHTVKDVCVIMSKKLGLQDAARVARYFGIFPTIDGKTCIDPAGEQDLIVDIHEKCSRLVFKIVYMTKGLMKRDDPGIAHLRYLQVLHDIVLGYCPCPLSLLDRVAALQLQKRFGPYNPSVHKSGFVVDKLLELLPLDAIKHRKPSRWESDIFKAYHEIGQHRSDPVSDVLKLVEPLDFYGTTCFEVDILTIGVPEPIEDNGVLLVSRDGLTLYDGDLANQLKHFMWNEIVSWGVRQEESNNNKFYMRDKDRGEYHMHLHGGPTNLAVCAFITRFALILVHEEGHHHETHHHRNSPKKQVEIENRNVETEHEEIDQEKQHRAAILLQAHARGILQRKRIDEEFFAILIQAAWRMHKAKKEATSIRQEARVVKIQANYRGYVQRRKLAELEEELAAVYIQALMRGWYTRKHSKLPPGEAPPPPDVPPPPIAPPPGIFVDDTGGIVRTDEAEDEEAPHVPPPPPIPPPGLDEEYDSDESYYEDDYENNENEVNRAAPPPPPDEPPPKVIKPFKPPKPPNSLPPVDDLDNNEYAV